MSTTTERSPVEVPEGWLVEDRARFGPFVTREAYRLTDGTRREWSSRRHRKANETLRPGSPWWQPRAIGWWIALLFAIGSFLFAIGVVPAYASAVGAAADAMTFFAGSIFFTSAGYLQFFQAINAPTDVAGGARGRRRWIAWQPARIDWWACGVQSIGTLFFNVSTFAATRSALDAAQAHEHDLATRHARVDRVHGRELAGVVRGLPRVVGRAAAQRLVVDRRDEPRWARSPSCSPRSPPTSTPRPARSRTSPWPTSARSSGRLGSSSARCCWSRRCGTPRLPS